MEQRSLRSHRKCEQPHRVPALNVPQPSAGDGDAIEVMRRYEVSLRAEGASANTIELRVGTVGVFARGAGCSPLALSTDAIREVLAGYPNANTKATHFVSIRRFSRWLVTEDIRPDDPTARIKAPRFPRRIPRPCSTPALEAMLEGAQGREKAMILLAAYAGLRAGDIATLKAEHIDLHAGTIYVRGKGGIEALLPLHPDTAAVAADMPASGWWFPAQRRAAGHISPEYVSTIMTKVFLRAGAPDRGAHPLRHWFGTWLVRSGTDLRTVQDLMRHASLNTTAGYLEVADESRRNAVLGLPDLRAAG